MGEACGKKGRRRMGRRESGNPGWDHCNTSGAHMWDWLEGGGNFKVKLRDVSLILLGIGPINVYVLV